MGTEIERKFLVFGEQWREYECVECRQGYVSADGQRTVRVRVGGQRAFLTVKGATRGATRLEFEYEIPLTDAEEMLVQLCQGPLIEKQRYRIPGGNVTWEVDEFSGANAGLVLAEVELQFEEQPVELPSWIGKEVTDDHRYYNAHLVRHPYQSWPENQ